MVDAFGHVSARHPSHPQSFLISRSVAPGEVTSEHIVEVDFDGHAVEKGSGSLYLERFIHAEVYRARPDVMAVVHSHSPSILPFTIVPGVPLRPVCHMSGFLYPQAPVFEIRDAAGESTDLLISTSALGKAMARALQDRSIVLMRGHGSTVVGSSVRSAVFRAIYSELNARLQREALQIGTPIFLTAGEATASAAATAGSIDRAWNLWLSQIVERVTPPRV